MVSQGGNQHCGAKHSLWVSWVMLPMAVLNKLEVFKETWEYLALNKKKEAALNKQGNALNKQGTILNKQGSSELVVAHIEHHPRGIRVPSNLQ